jgi:glycine/D-amino acid oxidase-like deaminating enzyme
MAPTTRSASRTFATSGAGDKLRGMHSPVDRAADVVVVGGGIVGTAAAAFLAEAGARVVLIEREGIASAASGANSGLIQQPFDPILADLYRETVELYRELSGATPSFQLPREPSGMLFLSESEATVRQQAEVIARGFPELRADVAGGTALQELDPVLGPDLWACLVDIGYPVVPAASTYAYATLAESRGVTIRQGRPATLEFRGDQVTGVRVGDQLLTAGAVLAAAGPWTPGLIDPTGRWAPIRPLWGAVVEIELADPPHHALEEASIEASIGTGMAAGIPNEHEFSLMPLPGVSVAGSTFLDTEPDPAAWIEPILERATRFVPAVDRAPIRGAHACPRPLSGDGRPLIGAVPGRRGLYMCAGHGPWGISTGPASARLVADLMLGRQPVIPAELDPGRF